MAKKERFEISSELDEKTSRPLEWQNVLFRQIDRILAAITEQKGDFMAGVEGLDMALAFFKEKDPSFHAEMKRIADEADKYVNDLRSIGGEIARGDLHGVAYARAKLKMEELLRLIGRAGFYPEQQAEWKPPAYE